ncbi:MAG: phosphoglucosamine mutase [Acidimicrobiales bacterium]
MAPAFGTDGIRGVANLELTAEFALALGRSAARNLEGGPWLVGRDTRLSGPMLQAALSAGLAAEGREVVDLGVIPTPGLSWLAARRGSPAAMISASHNGFRDNGIKLFGAGGTKLARTVESAIERELEHLTRVGLAGGVDTAGDDTRPSSTNARADVGRISEDPGATGDYAELLLSVVAGATPPVGEVVVDCANGSASAVAPLVFERFGVEHSILFAEPNGTNINSGCGSTDLSALAREVLSRGAVLGVAFDGDADRMLAVDHTGATVDGDQLIAMFARDLRASGRLKGDAVVVTVLSNLGLRLGLSAEGIELVETPVGDRHVADALESGGHVLGGEQSGHLIFREHSFTGDGILTSLKLMELLGRTGRSLAELASQSMRRLPQVMLNVPVLDPSRLGTTGPIWDEAAAVADELGDSGRVLLRASGTESCIRVMVEAETAEVAEGSARRIAAVVERELV